MNTFRSHLLFFLMLSATVCLANQDSKAVLKSTEPILELQHSSKTKKNFQFRKGDMVKVRDQKGNVFTGTLEEINTAFIQIKSKKDGSISKVSLTDIQAIKAASSPLLIAAKVIIGIASPFLVVALVSLGAWSLLALHGAIVWPALLFLLGLGIFGLLITVLFLNGFKKIDSEKYILRLGQH